MKVLFGLEYIARPMNRFTVIAFQWAETTDLEEPEQYLNICILGLCWTIVFDN